MIKINAEFLAEEAVKKFVDRQWKCLRFAADSILNTYNFQGDVRRKLYPQVLKHLNIKKREFFNTPPRFVITEEMRQEAILLQQEDEKWHIND